MDKQESKQVEVKAKLRYLRMSPKKVRVLTSLIQGMEVGRALDYLENINKKASRPLKKLIKSAIANAQHNFSLSPEILFIKKIVANPGPMLKRWRPRAMGRSVLIRRRTSHLEVVLSSLAGKEKEAFLKKNQGEEKGHKALEAKEKQKKEKVEEKGLEEKKEKKEEKIEKEEKKPTSKKKKDKKSFHILPFKKDKNKSSEKNNKK